MNRFRRVMGTLLSTVIPDTMTLAKRKVVMPPSTQSGMDATTPPNLPMSPKRKRNTAQLRPAAREAHRVSAITPLFWEKVVFGAVVISAASRELHPSASRPPCTRERT